MEPYATVEDLEERWRTLSPAEQGTAKTKLNDASVLVAVEGRRSGVEIDASDELANETAKAVVCEMVKRAMVAPADQVPMQSNNVTVGPFSEQFTYANPTGDLYMTSSEKRRLGFGRSRVGTMLPRIGGGDDEG